MRQAPGRSAESSAEAKTYGNGSREMRRNGDFMRTSMGFTEAELDDLTAPHIARLS